MSIDWFTFTAQVVNFLILMALLWRFLFRPILKVMNEREQGIAASLSDAARQEQQARDQLAMLQAERADFEQQKSKRLAAVESDAAALGQQLRESAKNEVDSQQQRWLETFAQHRAGLATEFRAELAGLVCSATRTALTDLADQPLEARMLDKFAAALDRLDANQQQQLRRSAAHSVAGLEVRTAFELTSEQKARLTGVIHDLIPQGLSPRFTRAIDGICGVELDAGDRRFAWTFESYLESLHRDLTRPEGDAAAEVDEAPTKAVRT